MPKGETPPDLQRVAFSREDRAQLIEKRLEEVKKLRQKHEDDLDLVRQEAELNQELVRLRNEIAEKAEAAAREKVARQKKK